MEEDAIRVDVSNLDGLVVVTVSGEIDFASAQVLDAALQALNSADHVVLDLVGLTFMDSSGMDLLLEHERRMNDAGGALLVRCPSSGDSESLRPHRAAHTPRGPATVGIHRT